MIWFKNKNKRRLGELGISELELTMSGTWNSEQYLHVPLQNIRSGAF